MHENSNDFEEAFILNRDMSVFTFVQLKSIQNYFPFNFGYIVINTMTKQKANIFISIYFAIIMKSAVASDKLSFIKKNNILAHEYFNVK